MDVITLFKTKKLISLRTEERRRLRELTRPEGEMRFWLKRGIVRYNGYAVIARQADRIVGWSACSHLGPLNGESTTTMIGVFVEEAFRGAAIGTCLVINILNAVRCTWPSTKVLYDERITKMVQAWLNTTGGVRCKVLNTSVR